MQVLNHPGFENRVLYNTAKNYSIQLVKGERYDLLKPVIALTIVNFDMFKDNNELINYFKVLNKKDFSAYNDDIGLIFIELNKFNKTHQQCQGIQDEWIFFLKNAGSLTIMPKNLPTAVETAYQASNEAGMSSEELELQYKKQEFIAVQISSLQQAEEVGLAKGEEKGLAKGLAKGREEEKFEIVRTMKRQNFDLETISKVTGLALELIKDI
jgi:predicted transposase/invertase (TIGR01784 family)